ncbi:MAG: hypothetical protein ABIT01_09930, partial [Thermoanaerobaculia bacterium]
MQIGSRLLFRCAALLLLLPGVRGDSQTIITVAGGESARTPRIATGIGISPSGVAVDAAGNIYIADFFNHSIRKVTVATGLISTLVGDASLGFAGDGGPATAAKLNFPAGVALDSSGNIFIADSGNNRIRKVSATGVITTVAGNGTKGSSGDGGPATAAALANPTGVAVDSAGSIFIAETDGHRIRKVSAAGVISTLAGTGTPAFSGDGGPATTAALDKPSGVAIDPAGNVLIADSLNHRIRRVNGSGV